MINPIHQRSCADKAYLTNMCLPHLKFRPSLNMRRSLLCICYLNWVKTTQILIIVSDIQLIFFTLNIFLTTITEIRSFVLYVVLCKHLFVFSSFFVLCHNIKVCFRLMILNFHLVSSASLVIIFFMKCIWNNSVNYFSVKNSLEISW